MLSIAMRAWYCAAGVNCGPVAQSPTAQIPAVLVRWWSSTTT
jgi:hypothetical protein